MKVSIGIDIGSRGAIALMKDGKLELTSSLPQTADKRPDLHAIYDLLTDWVNGHDTFHVTIEDLHSISGTGAKSNFQFGWINGATEAFLVSLNLPYTKVQAKKWQKEMWEGVRPVEIPTGKKDKNGNPKYKVDTKATSLIAAKRLFPLENFLASERSKVPHDGIVDAVLLCEYDRRHF